MKKWIVEQLISGAVLLMLMGIGWAIAAVGITVINMI